VTGKVLQFAGKGAHRSQTQIYKKATADDGIGNTIRIRGHAPGKLFKSIKVIIRRAAWWGFISLTFPWIRPCTVNPTYIQLATTPNIGLWRHSQGVVGSTHNSTMASSKLRYGTVNLAGWSLVTQLQLVYRRGSTHSDALYRNSVRRSAHTALHPTCFQVPRWTT